MPVPPFEIADDRKAVPVGENAEVVLLGFGLPIHSMLAMTVIPCPTEVDEVSDCFNLVNT
jgi:hypothetical protein